MEKKISPSLMCADFLHLGDELKKLDVTKPVLIEHNRAIIKSYSWTASKDGIVSGKVSLIMLPDIKYPNDI